MKEYTQEHILTKMKDLLEQAQENNYFENVIHHSHLSGCENLNELTNSLGEVVGYEFTDFGTLNDDESSILTPTQRETVAERYKQMSEDCKEELGFCLEDDSLTDEQREECWQFEQDWHVDGSDMQVLSLELKASHDFTKVTASLYTTYKNPPYFTSGEMLGEIVYPLNAFMELESIPMIENELKESK